MASIKKRVAAGEQLLGVLLRMPSEELLEMVGVRGFDFVVIDCEHGPADVVALRHHLMIAAAQDVPALVRVGSDEPALMLRALDQGAAGIIAPHVDSTDDAERLVAAAHYPPLGHRGFATYSRAGGFGTVAPQEHQQRLVEETVVIGMIESPTGVRAAREILTVPGLDGTMIGTADLRASSTADDPDPGASVAAVHALTAELGVLRMDIVTGPEAARRSLAEGAQLVVYNLAHTMMEHLATLRAVGARGEEADGDSDHPRGIPAPIGRGHRPGVRRRAGRTGRSDRVRPGRGPWSLRRRGPAESPPASTSSPTVRCPRSATPRTSRTGSPASTATPHADRPATSRTSRAS